MERKFFLKLIPGIKPGDYVALAQVVKHMSLEDDKPKLGKLLSFYVVDNDVQHRAIYFWEERRVVPSWFGRARYEHVRYVALVDSVPFRVRQMSQRGLSARVISTTTAQVVTAEMLGRHPATSTTAPLVPPAAHKPVAEAPSTDAATNNGAEPSAVPTPADQSVDGAQPLAEVLADAPERIETANGMEEDGKSPEIKQAIELLRKKRNAKAAKPA